jgi:hypothetical protein
MLNQLNPRTVLEATLLKVCLHQSKVQVRSLAKCEDTFGGDVATSGRPDETIPQIDLFDLLKSLHVLIPTHFLTEFQLPRIYDPTVIHPLAKGLVHTLRWIIQFEELMGEEFRDFDELYFDFVVDYLEEDILAIDQVFELIEDYVMQSIDEGVISVETSDKMMSIILSYTGE